MITSNDKAWLLHFKEGDAEAFRQLYQLLYRRLCYFAFSLVKNMDQAEDIATDCFVKVWTRKETFESEEGIKTYLYLTAKNACIDFLRAEKRHELSHQEISYLEAGSAPHQADLPMANAEIMSALYQQLDELPPKCARVFKLIYFEQKNTAEIAALMNTSTKTVLNQKLKAIALLKAQLLKKGLLPLLLLLRELK
jgi:RNA polymerase sigma-70 factor (family 1)